MEKEKGFISNFGHVELIPQEDFKAFGSNELLEPMMDAVRMLLKKRATLVYRDLFDVEYEDDLKRSALMRPYFDNFPEPGEQGFADAAIRNSEYADWLALEHRLGVIGNEWAWPEAADVWDMLMDAYEDLRKQAE